MHANFSPFPVLQTERLTLRPMTLADDNDLFSMRRDPRMHLFTDTKADECIADTRQYIEKMIQGVKENKWVIWAIEARESGRVIGSISIWNLNAEKNTAELGYGLNPEFQGEGYMQEALQCVVDYGVNKMQLAVLEAYTEAENAASSKLLLKCGFEKTGEVDDPGYFSERVFHMHVYQRS